MNVKDVLTSNGGRNIGQLLTEIGRRMERRYCIYGRIYEKSIFSGVAISNQL